MRAKSFGRGLLLAFLPSFLLPSLLSFLVSFFVGLGFWGCYEPPKPPPIDMEFGDKQKFYKDHPAVCGGMGRHMRECGF